MKKKKLRGLLFRTLLVSMLQKSLRKSIDWQLTLWAWTSKQEKYLREQNK
jgi:hypothetical protein